MTYAMTLDNSWELMNEDEMYDVNGGGTVNIIVTTGIIGNIAGAVAGGATSVAILSAWVYAGVTAAFASIGTAVAAPTLGLGTAAMVIAGAVVANLLVRRLVDMGVDAFLEWVGGRPTIYSTSFSGFLLPNLTLKF